MFIERTAMLANTKARLRLATLVLLLGTVTTTPLRAQQDSFRVDVSEAQFSVMSYSQILKEYGSQHPDAFKVIHFYEEKHTKRVRELITCGVITLGLEGVAIYSYINKQREVAAIFTLFSAVTGFIAITPATGVYHWNKPHLYNDLKIIEQTGTVRSKLEWRMRNDWWIKLIY
jgi:hypothetical protein